MQTRFRELIEHQFANIINLHAVLSICDQYFIRFVHVNLFPLYFEVDKSFHKSRER